MAYICATDGEDHVLGNVGGMVGNTLQITRDDERVERLGSACWLCVHDLGEGVKCFAADHVNHIIPSQNPCATSALSSIKAWSDW